MLLFVVFFVVCVLMVCVWGFLLLTLREVKPGFVDDVVAVIILGRGDFLIGFDSKQKIVCCGIQIIEWV